ncbi:hypothetical protein EMN47_06045 [Prolixibacteraceae bacterium JC049]|nr:hypothetical protein [Prolixibacteraceae bacterium JC049]
MKKSLFIVAILIWGTFLMGCSHRFYNPESGVSFDLAEYRATTIEQIEYSIFFSIPEDKNENITGREEIRFRLSNSKQPLVIDFSESRNKIKSVKIKGKDVEYIFENEHIIIPEKHLRSGKNSVEIEFIAGDMSLNRNDDFLYTLFVPDRARTAFPCFDQPDMKARFELSLEVPTKWQAVANGKIKQEVVNKKRKLVEYEITKPISTYLFAFAAGKFEKITKEKNGRSISLYHRESDQKKVDANVDRIFELVFHSIHWLEEYTGIPYPFAKYDMVAIPSFQYGGMEHTGATLYRASKLFLEESATENQKLARANLIAHETAHMWFGDLVTMKWFNDVWLKEVFANFMAGKIVNPMFPDVDHRLHFLIDHYPKAYAVDRTRGANPIGQQLDNLKDAGTLYGSIIYHKAPIIMNHLEQMIGGQKLRDGLKKYLKQFSYDNATWDQLISILDEQTPVNLIEWSNLWVYEPGMPRIEVARNDSMKNGMSYVQVDPMGFNRFWKQRLNILFGSEEQARVLPYDFNGPVADIDLRDDDMESVFVLPNGMGLAYGYFSLDKGTIKYLLNNVDAFEKPLTRGVVWLDLYENMLNGKFPPHQLLDALTRCVQKEKNAMLIGLNLGYLKQVFWRFIPTDKRVEYSLKLEKVLWDTMNKTTDRGVKRNLFNAWMNIVSSNEGIDRLLQLWNKKISIDGLNLSENDMITISLELAVRDVPNAREILNRQYNSVKNVDKKKMMRFVIPALSNDLLVRDAFFESLRDKKKREVEVWVLTALKYLHHPLRTANSEKYILPSLELLQEIQETGDIFFPTSWLMNTLRGYSSLETVDIVEQFLMAHPGFSPSLTNKILQAVDLVRRSAEIKQTHY